MPTLMGLPNEILTAIIEAIEPDDIESFSTCCKLIHSLARQRLEEHEHKKRVYSTVLVSDSTLPFPKPFQGEEYNTQLQGLLLDKWNGLYTKAIAVRFFELSTAETSAVNDLDGFEQQIESSMREVRNKIGLKTGGIEAREWGKHIREGNPSAILLCLLGFLPNLENLSIEYSTSWRLRLSAGYSKILSLMTKAALEQSKNEPSFGGRLSKCTVHGEYGVSLEKGTLPFLMMLPRIRVLQGYRLYIEDCSWPYVDAVSPIADLDLHGEIDADTLSSYLSGIGELKKFLYTHSSDADIPFSPFKIVASLRQSAFRSLVHLDLTTDAQCEPAWADGQPAIGSLRSFEVLETIRLQFILLFLDEQLSHLTRWLEYSYDGFTTEEQQLINFLPSSARTFRLEDINMRRLVLGIFEGFPEQREERLPKLDLISLDAGDELNTQIEKICGKLGVQLEVRQEEVRQDDFYIF